MASPPKEDVSDRAERRLFDTNNNNNDTHQLCPMSNLRAPEAGGVPAPAPAPSSPSAVASGTGSWLRNGARSEIDAAGRYIIRPAGRMFGHRKLEHENCSSRHFFAAHWPRAMRVAPGACRPLGRSLADAHFSGAAQATKATSAAGELEP